MRYMCVKPVAVTLVTQLNYKLQGVRADSADNPKVYLALAMAEVTVLRVEVSPPYT